MAPVKFENKIKDKLETRTIQPSDAAWDTLSSQLNTESKKQKRSMYFYFGIAASIVGVLVVTTLFFKSSEDQTIIPQVVETPVKVKQQEPMTHTSENDVVITADSKQIDMEVNQRYMIPQKESSAQNKHVANVSEDKHTNQSITTIKTHNTGIVANVPVETVKEPVSINELTFEEAKAIEVVERIKSIEVENGTVTDAEIENLLKQAEKEILRQRIYNETTRTVDADALLQDVEDDLEQSFRTRVFETLKSSYKTVKTAVAERNN
ncbi:hypothetical protein [Psychroserpens algicola]|uniref:hypothetical protein n=1 Tax=Psychroserpens algicola TaxID=1719034 RepID=UPI001953FF07|nr:hypothetical protein [Psychroserpens algicola]